MNTSETSKPVWRVAVIGGGLTGLAAAHRLVELSAEKQRSIELTVFEASPRVGGVIGTRRIDEYLVETGSDSFITNKPWAVDLCRRLGLADRLIPTDETYRRSYVLRAGRPLPVPEGFMLLSPARVWPVLTSRIFSLPGKLRMGLEYFVPRKADNGDESLAAFVRRRFGREVLDRLVQPLVGGIYTSDPEKLSLKATMPRFIEMEQQYRSLIRASRRQLSAQTTAEQADSGARYSLFLTLEAGLSEMLDELKSRVAAAGRFRLNTAVSSLRAVGGEGGAGSPRVWEVTSTDETRETYDAVIVTLRAPQAADVLKDVDVRLSALLGQIQYASTAIVVSGHRLADIADPLDAFGLVIPAAEKRKILAVSYASRKFPGRAPEGHVILRTFVGGAMQPELFELGDDEIKTLVRDELAEILGVTGREDFSIVARFQNAMPQYHVGHLQRVEQIEQLANQHANLALAGNAYHGVGIPDCIHSGEQAAERVFSGE